MDYESFGEHQWEDTGIFDFLRSMPEMVLRHPDTSFKTATETVEGYDVAGEYDVPDVLTWADTDRDLTAWTGNDIQRDALNAIYHIEEDVMKTRKRDIIETWRKLQTSDHFYYMCTKWSNDGDVHAYFSPYQSPYEAYIAFMNALSDLQLRVSQELAAQTEATDKVTDKPKQDDPPTDSSSRGNDEEAVEIEETLPEVEPDATGHWWDKIKNKLPFFNRLRKAGISS
jgi:alpha-amylase